MQRLDKLRAKEKKKGESKRIGRFCARLIVGFRQPLDGGE